MHEVPEQEGKARKGEASQKEQEAPNIGEDRSRINDPGGPLLLQRGGEQREPVVNIIDKAPSGTEQAGRFQLWSEGVRSD